MKLKEDLVSEARQMAKKLATEGKLVHKRQDILDKIKEGESLASFCSKYEISAVDGMQKIVHKWYRSSSLLLTLSKG